MRETRPDQLSWFPFMSLSACAVVSCVPSAAQPGGVLLPWNSPEARAFKKCRGPGGTHRVPLWFVASFSPVFSFDLHGKPGTWVPIYSSEKPRFHTLK